MTDHGRDAIPPAPLTPQGFYGASLVFTKFLGRRFLSLIEAEVTGREHVPAEGGFIFASNHASYLDPPVLAVACPRPLSYFAKAELFRNPLFSKLIRSLGAFPVRRGKGDRDALSTALELLAKGHGLVIFPEGTRTLTGEIGRMKAGVAMMALKAKVPIIPVGIEGTFEAWPKNGRFRSRPVRVSIGPRIDSTGCADDAPGYRLLTGRLTEAVRGLKFASRERMP